jgi:hypothetical protein
MVMSTIGKAILICILMLYVTSCNTVYTEKQTEALSRVVYATKDSLDAARIDLADQYAIEATRIVKPPKQRISVQTVYKKEQSAVVDAAKPTAMNNKRVIIIPEKYKQDLVVVVKSEDYQKLLLDKETLEQIEKENKDLIEAKKFVDEELIKQNEFRDQMVKDINALQKEIAEKNLAILHRNIIISGMVVVVGIGVFLKIKGILI